MDVAELDRLRYAFLKRLYELSEANRRRAFEMWAIGRELGLDRRGTAHIFDYLKEEGLAEFRAAGGMVAITHEGIHAIEDSFGEPETARSYFPEINIAVIGKMVDSQLQQGTRASTQTATGNIDGDTTEIGTGKVSDPSAELKEQRLAFLHRLYEQVEGGAGRMVSSRAIGGELAFADDRTDQIVRYLADEWLLERAGFGDHVKLTHEGVKEVEQAKRRPPEGTEHFPAQVIQNFFVAETVQGSQVQLGTVGSSQTMSSGNLDQVRELVRELRAAIDELEFDDATAESIRADVGALESQLARPEPEPGLIKGLLRSTQHVLEGAAGGVMAEHSHKLVELARQIEHLISSLPR